MKKIHSFNVILGLGVLLSLNSCGGGNESEKKDDIKDTLVVTETNKEINENNETSLYSLPSPVQIAEIFKKAGLKYFTGITNPVENSNKYSSGNTVTKTLGLGVYLADLSYCILNKQNQESKNYLKTCIQLAESVGLAKAFKSNHVPERIEKNMESQDSIAMILAEIQLRADNLLAENKQGYISVITFTGAWIESMYIGTQVHEKEKNPNVTIHIIEQMGIVENIVKALTVTSASKDVDVSYLLQEMKAIDTMYNNFKSVMEIKISDPDVIDPAKLTISAEELLGFSKKIEEIRNHIVKG
jgi:hypothetical protein